MTDEERVVRAIRCELPDDPVVRIHIDQGRFQVELASGAGRRGTLPRTADEQEPRDLRHGFEIIDMFGTEMPPMKVIGVALFDDGEDCLLNDKAGLVRFYGRASAAFDDPLQFAWRFVVLYQTYGLSWFIVLRLSVFDGLELSKPVTEIPGFTLPRLEGDKLEFWSYFIGPIGFPQWVSLQRWRLTGLGGDLDWEQTDDTSIPLNAPEGVTRSL